MRDAGGAIALLALCAVFGVATIGLPPTARLVPQVVLVVTALLLTLQLGAQLLRRKMALGGDKEHNRVTAGPRLLVDIAWFAAAPLTLWVMGIVAGGALYAFVFLTVRAHTRWSRAVPYTVALLAVLIAVSTWVPGASGMDGLWRLPRG